MSIDIAYIAQACHEANRIVQRATGDPAPSPHWEDAPQWQRDSAISGVQATLDGQTPAALHLSWCSQKWADGWVYGEVKDAEAKTHPCLVPFHDLPKEQIVKDELFQAIVDALSTL